VRHALKKTISRVQGLRRSALIPRRQRIYGWLLRYGPAEVIGAASAFLGSFAVHHATGNEIYAAYGAAICELLGFYGMIISRDMVAEHRAASMEPGAPKHVRGIRRVFGRAILEFAPAEVLDAAVVRPLAMGVATNLLGRAWGVTTGKILADCAFYTVVLTGEAIRRRRAGATADASV
jgi:hypothetical protein